MKIKIKNTFLLSLILATILCGADLFTKQLAIEYLTPHIPNNILPFLNFTLVFNKGVAFSFLSDVEYAFWIILLFSLSVMIYIVSLLYREKDKLTIIAFSFILGGAMGNFIDRIIAGAVTDFISVHWQGKYYFAIFNVADIFINIGLYLLIIDFFMYRKNKNG